MNFCNARAISKTRKTAAPPDLHVDRSQSFCAKQSNALRDCVWQTTTVSKPGNIMTAAAAFRHAHSAASRIPCGYSAEKAIAQKRGVEADWDNISCGAHQSTARRRRGTREVQKCRVGQAIELTGYRSKKSCEDDKNDRRGEIRRLQCCGTVLQCPFA